MDQTRDDDRGPEGIAPPEAWLGYLLNQLALEVRERTAAALVPFGLTPRGLGLLVALAAESGSNQTGLRRRLAMDRTTMSHLVESLVQEGWIMRGERPGDRRSDALRLTRDGRRRLSLAAAAAGQAERDVAASVTPDALRQAKGTLGQILAALRDGEGGRD